MGYFPSGFFLLGLLWQILDNVQEPVGIRKRRLVD
jgi:hypothetical protein